MEIVATRLAFSISIAIQDVHLGVTRSKHQEERVDINHMFLLYCSTKDNIHQFIWCPIVELFGNIDRKYGEFCLLVTWCLNIVSLVNLCKMDKRVRWTLYSNVWGATTLLEYVQSFHVWCRHWLNVYVRKLEGTIMWQLEHVGFVSLWMFNPFYGT